MTAIFVLRQNTSVHILSDGAAYDSTGEVHSVDLAKCVALPDLHMAIAATGPALLSRFLGERITDEFDSFDDFVSRGESLLPNMFLDYINDHRGGDAVSTLYAAGWHRAANRPAAFCMNMWSDTSSRIEQVIENSSLDGEAERFKFDESCLAGTPLPDIDLIEAAGLKIPETAEGVNKIRPEIDLLHLMEIARHQEIEGRHLVGGNALLTSIDANGMKQKIVHKWEEDKVGWLISPTPITDWKAWRTARLRPRPGLSFGRA